MRRFGGHATFSHMQVGRADHTVTEGKLLNPSRPGSRSQGITKSAQEPIVTHYFHHDAWLEDGMLLRHASSLAHIPGILIHGRLDLGSPLVTAWELAQAWPHSELVIVSGAGHASTDPGMSEALMTATDRFAIRR